MNRLTVISYYKWKILFWIILFSLIATAFIYGPEYGIDQKFVVFTTVVLGIFTQVFAGITSLVALIPFFGPFIIKVISIPIFYIVNSTRRRNSQYLSPFCCACIRSSVVEYRVDYICGLDSATF